MTKWQAISVVLALASIGLAIWSIALSRLSRADLRRIAELRKRQHSPVEPSHEQRSNCDDDRKRREPVGRQRATVSAMGE
jgi:hypothetical protein